jgi:hypothetical protein
MGADQARDRGVTGSPLRLSPLAPARKTRSGAGTRAREASRPLVWLLTFSVEWLFLPQTCRSKSASGSAQLDGQGTFAPDFCAI